MSDDIHPTDELICELLAARHRLGEQIWTLSRNGTVTKALARLEGYGMVGYKHGIVEDTYLAWLTDAGRAEYMKGDYIPPIMANDKHCRLRRRIAATRDCLPSADNGYWDLEKLKDSLQMLLDMDEEDNR